MIHKQSLYAHQASRFMRCGDTYGGTERGPEQYDSVPVLIIIILITQTDNLDEKVISLHKDLYFKHQLIFKYSL